MNCNIGKQSKEYLGYRWKNKYRIIFDPLVADCEGALYCILKDKPDF